MQDRAGEPDREPPRETSVAAWDLPTRLFKWLLVVLVVMAWASNKYGGGHAALA